jgi:hypothetical protein
MRSAKSREELGQETNGMESREKRMEEIAWRG